MTDIVERLRGIYRVSITDGIGPVGAGEEPNNPNEFVRQFDTAFLPPIQREAADVIEAGRSRAETAERLLQEMTEYALDATKALTGLAGGGSEMFSGRIGNIFKADIDKCCQVVRDRHDRAHQFMVKAVKEKNAAVEQSEAMAKAAYLAGFNASGEGYNAEYGIDSRETDERWLANRDEALVSYRNREGNGNAL